MSANSIRLDALIRVSQRAGRQDKDLRSPDQQRKVIEDSDVVRNGAKVYWHPAAIDSSGKTMDRKDIALVLERIRSGQTDGLVVAYTSRFSRARVDEALAIKAAVEEAGGRLVVCDIGGIDIDSAAGELVFTTLLAMARYQWREIADRFETSRSNAVREGKSMGATFGYRYTDSTPKTNRQGHQVPGVADSHLVVVEELRPIIRQLFEKKAAGATWLELARWLDTVAPKSDGRAWSRSTVATMVKSKTYLGEVRHGKKHVNPEAHEPLVSPSVWRRAQNEPGHRTPRGRYMLTGLARCAGCGRTMRGSTLSKRSGKHRYTCVTKECSAQSTITLDRLEDEVIRHMMFVEVNTPDLPTEEGELADAQAEVERLTLRVQTLAAVEPSHPVAIAAHQERLAEIEQELEAAEDARDRLEPSTEPSSERFQQALTEWLDASPEERDRREAESGPATLPYPEHTRDELRGHLRAKVDGVLVRKANGYGPASETSHRVLVLFKGDASPELLERDSLNEWTWDTDATTLSCTPFAGM